MSRVVAVALIGACVGSAVVGSSMSRDESHTEHHTVTTSVGLVPKSVGLVKDSTPSVAPTDAVGHPTFVSPHSNPIVAVDGQVFVVNTPCDTVDVIDSAKRQVIARINVGIDPVSLAVRPDHRELWVSNHVSDSVSVIDNDPESVTYLQVVATIQQFDTESRSTEFDEPVGIAFANNEKAYVALSSENKIAVVDVESRTVTRMLDITAQDPRAIFVRGDRLYVVPFESNNQTQLSGGTGPIDGDLVTFNAHEHAVANNNVLSIGAVSDIIKHPEVPDRDLYIFDTSSDELVEVVDGLGTLLYGIAVDSNGQAFVAQTDARNDANGRAGTKGHGLGELENRAFLNRVTQVELQGGKATTPKFIDLEPLPPEQPAKGQALATPFAIQISDDDSTLYVSAAGSDKLVTIDAESGRILGRVDVEAVPRGIALEKTQDDSHNAWVFNAVANSISLVDVSNPAELRLVESIALEDPTHPQVKLGRIAFNTASASTTETFSCASCHPDGHTDQLLWVLKTPVVTGGDQIMPRSTMPIRGLRDTEPYHWDGIPGDPYGGNNSANVWGEDPPNSDKEDPTSSTRHLIDGGLAATMAMVGNEGVNDEGKQGRLSAAERDAMAVFLLSVPYPPAPQRAYDNVVSHRAMQGFKLFHIDGDHQDDPTPNVCGNCHRMPFLVSTNTPGTGMDAPTWRGAYDRWLILPQGRLNVIDFDFFKRLTDFGIPERHMWRLSWAGRRRFDPVWNMVLEGSTGYSGSLGRQITLSDATAQSELTDGLLNALETSAVEGAVVLQVDGVMIDESKTTPVQMRFEEGSYVCNEGFRTVVSREELIALAMEGRFVGTFTARHGANADFDHPQPGLWTLGPIEQQRGRQDFPVLWPSNQTMRVSARHVGQDAYVIVDGRRVEGLLSIDGEALTIELPQLPAVGMHLLQVQNRGGLFSNDFIFHVTESADAARELRNVMDRQHVDARSAIRAAISRNDLPEIERLLEDGTDVNRRERDGSTPLSSAALFGNLEIAKYLIEQGADVERTNRDGNTPLHVAAFLCRTEVVKLLLEHGASPHTENGRGESAIDVVSSDWNEGLAGFYRGIGQSIGQDLDLERVQRTRPDIVELLRQATDD